ncbi:MAG: hypothetical protein ACLRTM_22940, partial [Clostridium sp.]
PQTGYFQTPSRPLPAASRSPFPAGWASFLGNKGYLGDVLWELWMVVGSRNVVLPEEMTDDLM